MDESTPPPPPPPTRGRGTPPKAAGASSPPKAAASSPPKTRAKGKKKAAPKASSKPVTPQQQDGASLPVGNAWLVSITPPSSTVPSIFAESPNNSQTQIQGQPVVAANASPKRTADQDVDSPATKLRKTATEPKAQQASQNGLRVVNGLTLPTSAEPKPPKTTGLRTVGRLTMPSLPEPQTPSQAPNQAPSQAPNNGIRDDGEEFTFTVPGFPGSQGPSHASNNGKRTFEEFTMPGLPQASVQTPNNGSLRTGSGLTTSSIPEPSLAQPPHQVPNNGCLRLANSLATPNLSTSSQYSNTVRGTQPQVQEPRATVNRQLPAFADPPGSDLGQPARPIPKVQQFKHSATGMLCPGCDISKDGCYPFWLCAECRPDGTPQNSRDAEYQALNQQFRSYQVIAKTYNANAMAEIRKHEAQNKVLTERNQELEQENLKSMALISQAKTMAKAYKELQQKVQPDEQRVQPGHQVGNADALAKEVLELQERVQQQHQLITALKHKTGADYFTTTGEEPAVSQTSLAGLIPLFNQAPSCSQSPTNQGVRQSSPNRLAMNRALSPGQNQNAFAMRQAASLRENHARATMDHDRASSQGTTHFPSNQGMLPQSNLYALMNMGQSLLHQSGNGVPIQGMSPGRNPNAVATSQTVSPRPSQAGTAMGHCRASSEGTVHFSSNQAAVSPQPTPNVLSKISPSPSLSPNGFAVNHTQSFGNGFNAATVGQGSSPNSFAMNQSQGLGPNVIGLGMNNGASIDQGQGTNAFDVNQGGNSGQGSAYDSSYLQLGDGVGLQYPSPGR